ncbi:MAG: Mov34/MPN/PAD-1 family protein [Pseudomonadota bacterium]
MSAAAEHLFRVAQSHPECCGGLVLGADAVRLDIRVEMPLHMKADGLSATGVRTVEPVTFSIPASYPWQSPRVSLRADFPRTFPHLLPGASDAPPRPCLVDGDQNEFFLQFGLVEYGLFHLVEQMAVWLRKAAISDLIDPAQGWEPMMRRGLVDVVAIDAEAARGAVRKAGGYVAWRARFLRRGERDGQLLADASAWIDSGALKTPLNREDDTLFTGSRVSNGVSRGATVVGIMWPDKPPSGGELINDRYLPEDVTDLRGLRARAELYGCERSLDLFLSSVSRCFEGYHIDAVIPVGVILCVRRPFHLIGSSSTVELLPYIIELRPFAGRKALLAHGDDEPVAPALHFQSLTSGLLRTLSGAPKRAPLALLGCGSVGSKLALHAARAGQPIVAVSDNGWLRPHNMARHGLGPGRDGTNKAEALAGELRELGQETAHNVEDIAFGLRDGDLRTQIVPASAKLVVNATASLAVREALTATTRPRDRNRQIEAALFGRGRVGYLLIDGADHNPNHCDLMAELYATVDDPEVASLLFDPDEGLAEVQIGQGCGSLTMTVDDAQLSMMTAGLAKEINKADDQRDKDGAIVIGISGSDAPTMRWSRRTVPPFETVAIEGSDGWHLRIAARVAERIRSEAASFKNVETGGLMVGLSSARLKSVTVVDILDAPPDSERSATLFLLGTQGLRKSIESRHLASGRTLFDVGTWHSHLADEGPSATDWNTAADLAISRAPPSILLIVTPRRFHALIAKDKAVG